MKRRQCPHCGDSGTSNKDLWNHLLFRKKLYCGSCTTRLKLKIGLLTSFISGVLSQLILLAAIFIGLYFQSWFIFILVVLSSIALELLIFRYGTLISLGGKRFSLNENL